MPELLALECRPLVKMTCKSVRVTWRTFRVSYGYLMKEKNHSFDAEHLRQLDELADVIEVERLKRMGVIRDVISKEDMDCKFLSSRMVGSWCKKRKDGVSMYLRRSRLVGREFKWLGDADDQLFSPATSHCATRLLPALFCHQMSLCEND